jgi:hypothetical protein
MASDSNADLRLDAALRAFHRRQSAAVANEDCPSAANLLDYLDGRLAEDQVASIHDHLPHCAACRDVVLSFRDEPVAEGPRLSGAAELDRPAWRTRWWMPAVACASGLLVFAIIALNLYPSRRSMLSYVDAEDLGFAARSGADKLNPMAAAYQRGIAALVDSQTWIFRRTDERRLDEAIRSLEEAKALAVKRGNQTYQGDCAYYLGKAYLKRNDVARARWEFEEVSKLDDPSQALLMRKRLAEKALRQWPSIE